MEIKFLALKNKTLNKYLVWVQYANFGSETREITV